MKGTIKITLEFKDGCKTEAEFHGEPGSAFTRKDDLNQFEKALRGFVDKLNKIQGVDDPRCKDCKHWGRGKATINAYRESNVCFKKRKRILHPKFKDQVLYYCKPRMCKACGEFERKGGDK